MYFLTGLGMGVAWDWGAAMLKDCETGAQAANCILIQDRRRPRQGCAMNARSVLCLSVVVDQKDRQHSALP